MKPVWLLLLFNFCFFAIIAVSSTRFNCTGETTCEGLIGYVPVNATTVSSIKDLFGVKNLKALLAANSWPLSDTARNISAGSTVRVPFPCICNDGRGVSNLTPVYTVKKGDTLYNIATNTFNAFVTYEEIAEDNKIKDPNLIDVERKLWIPLPCSCDKVDGARVVHYGHSVVSGSSLKDVAEEFKTTEKTLMDVNGIQDPTKLHVGEVLDVPLKACSASACSGLCSSVKSSLDSSFIVPIGSNAITSDNCIECSCSSSNLQLQCKEVVGANKSTCSTGGAPASHSSASSAVGLGELSKSLILIMLYFSFPW